MNPTDPQFHWIIDGLLALVSLLLAIVAWFSKSAVNLYRAKIDTLERVTAMCITRDEFRVEIDKRFDDMDTRRIQMHNHNVEVNNRSAETLNRLAVAVDGLRSDMREDLRGVYDRIDQIRERR